MLSEGKKPLVSVVMPTYNGADFIGSAVASVLAQTMTDWELQIVDDCSTDNTEQVLKPYLEAYPAKIHFLRLSDNGGPQKARTEAMRRAQGKYIAFCDCDDLWYPEKLEKQIAFMEQNNVCFSATGYEQMDEKGKRLGIALFPPKQCSYHRMLLLSNPIGNSTVIYDQEVIGKIGVPDIRKRNDFALWLSILHRCDDCAGMQTVLTSYRIRPNSVSAHKLAQAKYHWMLYRRIEKLSLISSVWYMLCWAFVKGTGIGLNIKRDW